MSEHTTIYELPAFWQEKIRSLKAENRNLRDRLMLAGPHHRDKAKKLVSENHGLRTRLRAADERIAELEAGRGVE